VVEQRASCDVADEERPRRLRRGAAQSAFASLRLRSAADSVASLLWLQGTLHGEPIRSSPKPPKFQQRPTLPFTDEFAAINHPDGVFERDLPRLHRRGVVLLGDPQRN
jgi:hypothetical protein